MASRIKIFITGATGYIGGSVLERLQNHPEASNFEITAIVRSAQKAEKFKEFGVNALVGSFNDAKLLEDLTAATDIVFDAVDADALEAARIMLRGFRESSKRRGNLQSSSTLLYLQSGTGVLSDDAVDLRASDVIWDDANPDQLETLPPTARHRDVDLEIIRADEEGYVRAYLVAPAVIYGIASGKFVDAGLQHKHSILVPILVDASLHRGRAGMFGKGVSIWPNVHVDDTLTCTSTFTMRSKQTTNVVGHGRKGYYFGLNGEHTMYDVSKELGRALVALGKSSDEEPTAFTKEEIDKYFNVSLWKFKSLANNSMAIGWKPKRTTKDFLEGIKPELEEIFRMNYKRLAPPP